MTRYLGAVTHDGAVEAYDACRMLMPTACKGDLDVQHPWCPLGLQDKPHVSTYPARSTCKRGANTGTRDEMCGRGSTGFKVLYTNIDGVPNKMDELLLRIEDDKPDIIVLTECIPKAQCRPLSMACFSVGDDFTSYLNFDPEQENMGLLGIRGVGILVRRNLSPSEVLFESSFKEAMWIRLKLRLSDELVLGVIYRSPSGDGHRSTEALCA